MIFGKLWVAQEEQILLENINENQFSIQKKLLAKGFSRSVKAIQRKRLRLLSPLITPNDNSQVPQYDLEDHQNELYVPPTEHDPYDNLTKGINYVSGALPLSTLDKQTKFVMLNDVHVPHNINLDSVFKFIYEYKPDYVLLVGDILNADPFSHWDKKTPLRFKNMPQPKAYYNHCNDVFYKPLMDVSINAKRIHWIGNHEYWSNKAISEMPEGEGYWETENNVFGIDAWVASKGIASLGKLHFLHGDILKSNVNAAKRMVSMFHRSVRFGHFHSLEEAGQQDPVDVKDRHTARCCGTLQKFNPSYMNGQPHNWFSAFTYGVVQNETGNFWDHTTQIINNQFWANGKLY